LRGRDEVFLMNTLTDAQLIVSSDVVQLLDRIGAGQEQDADISEADRETVELLSDNGFLVETRETELEALDRYFGDVKSSTAELNVTILTTLQCNFACDYCYQGDHGDYNKFAEKMTLQTAERVAFWIERELDRVNPRQFRLTFFGGEPLLNLPIVYFLAERLWQSARDRAVPMKVNVITNGLLLSEEVVDRLLSYGLDGVKVTLDGDQSTHDRMRPLRGGQGTFNRIIENIRRVAGRCNISIGGNFDESSVDSYPALLDFLRQQEFADKLVRVRFKPVVRLDSPPTQAPARAGVFPLIPIGANGAPSKPLNGTCMTSVGSGSATACDSCAFLEDKMADLREETRKRGFWPGDGVHIGPCHVHIQHAHTIGPDGSLYPCPGFTGDQAQSTGHIDGRRDAIRDEVRARFDRLSPWKECGDCAFIPVCAGGCVTASHTTLGDMNKPTCHKRALESAVISLAHDAASAA
jgi:uncharacterized protein